MGLRRPRDGGGCVWRRCGRWPERGSAAVGGYAEDHPGYVDRLRRLPQVGDPGLASVAFMAPDVGLGPPPRLAAGTWPR
jgi:hypothetical protein